MRLELMDIFIFQLVAIIVEGGHATIGYTQRRYFFSSLMKKSS